MYTCLFANFYNHMVPMLYFLILWAWQSPFYTLISYSRALTFPSCALCQLLPLPNSLLPQLPFLFWRQLTLALVSHPKEAWLSALPAPTLSLVKASYDRSAEEVFSFYFPNTTFYSSLMTPFVILLYTSILRLAWLVISLLVFLLPLLIYRDWNKRPEQRLFV